MKEQRPFDARTETENFSLMMDSFFVVLLVGIFYCVFS